jgi:hypothetical protein
MAGTARRHQSCARLPRGTGQRFRMRHRLGTQCPRRSPSDRRSHQHLGVCVPGVRQRADMVLCNDTRVREFPTWFHFSLALFDQPKLTISQLNFY